MVLILTPVYSNVIRTCSLVFSAISLPPMDHLSWVCWPLLGMYLGPNMCSYILCILCQCNVVQVCTCALSSPKCFCFCTFALCHLVSSEETVSCYIQFAPGFCSRVRVALCLPVFVFYRRVCVTPVITEYYTIV